MVDFEDTEEKRELLSGAEADNSEYFTVVANTYSVKYPSSSPEVVESSTISTTTTTMMDYSNIPIPKEVHYIWLGPIRFQIHYPWLILTKVFKKQAQLRAAISQFDE